MIEATFIRDNKEAIVSFEVTGHAGFAEAGSDIVCAAVSVLAIETVNSMHKLANHQMIVEEADDDGGYLYAHVNSNLSPKQQEVSQVLLEHLYHSLKDVSDTYPDYVRVIQ